MPRTPAMFQKLRASLEGDVPTQTEVRHCLGLSLAQVVFDFDDRETKKLLGLTPPLQIHTSERDLWILPDAEKTEQKVLTIPQNKRLIKECSHLGVLSLGDDLMQKFRNEIKVKLQKNVEAQLMRERQLFEAEKRRALELNSQNLHSAWQKYINLLQSDIQDKLQDELERVIRKCNREIQKTVVQQRLDMTQQMMKKMRTEVSMMIDGLYEELDRTRRSQVETIIADFNDIMRKEHVKMNELVNKMEKERKEELQLQKHTFELQNLADVLYVVCLEKLRAKMERHGIEKRAQKQIYAVHKQLMDVNELLKQSKKTICQYRTENASLQEKLCRINCSFHKFINLALNSVPEQTRFLLCKELTCMQDSKQ